MEGDTPFLPQEIITNILKRLPVKSLIRFQCVCKHWRNLIKNPSFIADHLQRSTHQNPCLLSRQTYMGFGFSPIVNDYVMVKNFVKVEYDDVVSRAEAYSLRTGSWKEIEYANFVSANSFDCGVAANGAIFWDGIKREKDEFFYPLHNNSSRTP